MAKITGEACVLALRANKNSISAKGLASRMGTDSRSVATALRKPVADGCVTRSYHRPEKGQQICAFYRFVRLKPKAPGK